MPGQRLNSEALSHHAYLRRDVWEDVLSLALSDFLYCR